MTTAFNRRAALGAIAAGAILAAPGAAKAANTDAELFALQGPIEVADRELDAALATLGIVEGKEKALFPVKPTPPAMDSASRQAIEEFGRRMAEIQAQAPAPEQAANDEALRQWEKDKARARVECGLDAAHAAEAEALAAVMELQARVVETPARTIAGLIFKARYAAAKDYDQEVLTSIADDLLAMAGDA